MQADEVETEERIRRDYASCREEFIEAKVMEARNETPRKQRNVSTK